jgi:hypothetical protein
MTQEEIHAAEWHDYRMRIAREHPTWTTRQIDRAAKQLAASEGKGDLPRGSSSRSTWILVGLFALWFVVSHGGCNTNSEDAEITHRF